MNDQCLLPLPTQRTKVNSFRMLLRSKTKHRGQLIVTEISTTRRRCWGVDEAADGRRQGNGRRVQLGGGPRSIVVGQDHGWIGTRQSSSNNKCESSPFNWESRLNAVDVERDADLMTIYRCTSHMIARPFTDHWHPSTYDAFSYGSLLENSTYCCYCSRIRKRFAIGTNTT